MKFFMLIGFEIIYIYVYVRVMIGSVEKWDLLDIVICYKILFFINVVYIIFLVGYLIIVIIVWYKCI